MHADLQIDAAGTELAHAFSRSIGVEERINMGEDAFREFYESTARPLYCYLLRVSGRHDVAEDVMQESYCRMLSAKLPAMDDAQKKSYLFRIAANLLRDRWRRGQEVPEENLPEPAAPGHDPEAQTDMRRVFDQLKPRERQLLWLAYVEGANHKEIAESAGLRPGSIRLLLFRARRRLADMLRSQSAEAEMKI
jgi:RNA polymerase sigma-70 factor (ECF subfamily)